jgi:DNA-directed RNA polymerase specialized sigma24 family protein
VVSQVESQVDSDGWDLDKFEKEKAKLDADDLNLLNMRYFQGLKYREISLVLGEPISTIQSKLQRLRERLRRTDGETEDFNE